MSALSSPRIARLLLQVALATLTLAGCKSESGGESEEKSASGESTEKPGNAEGAEGVEAAAGSTNVRLDLAIWRALLEESARAELGADGLFVDLGTVDGHKYTHGGFATGWGPNEVAETTTYAPMMRKNGLLYLPPTLDRAPASVQVRARSQCTAQTLAIGAAAAQPLTPEWQTLRFDIQPEAGAALPLVAVTECPQGAAHVDWVWLDQSKDGTAPNLDGDAVRPRQTTLTFGDSPKRVLDASHGERYAFYLDVPENAQLVFDRGAEQVGKFVVTATWDGTTEPLELAMAPAAPGEWVETAIDLAPVAGKAIRLSLSFDGEGPAGWGEPDVMVPRDQLKRGEGMGFGGAPQRVLLITVDGLRADAIAALTDTPLSETPHLDAHVKRGTVFTDAYSAATWPRPAAVTTLASLSPSTHGIADETGQVAPEIEFLSETLQAEGWATGAAVTDPTLDPAFGFADQGFEDYVRVPDDGTAVNETINWMGSHQSKPAFFWLALSGTHLPWDDEASGVGWGPGIREAGEVITTEDIAAARAGYASELADLDRALGALDKMMLEEMVVVIAGTHGSLLGENGAIGHGEGLDLASFRVPIIIAAPGVIPAEREVESIVELVDIAPTILELVDLGAGEHHQGVSLTGAIEGDSTLRPAVAVAEHKTGAVSLVMPHRHLVAKNTGGGEAAEADGNPSGPLATQLAWVHFGEAWANPTKSRRMDDKRHDLKFDSVEVDMDPELKKQLEALGYFGD